MVVYTIYMILLFHILVALGSLLYTAYVFFAPSQSKLTVSYVLTALTVISGCYLILVEPAHLTEDCITGITYLVVMFVGIYITQRKLANQQILKND